MSNNVLKTALAAVSAAGEAIQKHYQSLPEISIKPDNSPVTFADKQAEEIIIDTIAKEFPTHSFLGEETGNNMSDKDFVWIIDPIDGTNNFIRHIPIFATQLALYHNGEFILGISNNPIKQELLHATKGDGAFINGKQTKVSIIKDHSEAFVCHGGIRNFFDNGLSKHLENYSKSARSCRGYSDFWGYQLLAEGKVDAMIEYGVHIWDVAAMATIIPEAGGKITDLQGNPLSLESTTTIASNSYLHNHIVEIFS